MEFPQSDRVMFLPSVLLSHILITGFVSSLPPLLLLSANKVFLPGSMCTLLTWGSASVVIVYLSVLDNVHHNSFCLPHCRSWHQIYSATSTTPFRSISLHAVEAGSRDMSSSSRSPGGHSLGECLEGGRSIRSSYLSRGNVIGSEGSSKWLQTPPVISPDKHLTGLTVCLAGSSPQISLSSSSRSITPKIDSDSSV